ncbi:hypothetical protein IAT38_001089 [Cryptococcus sp. DSM 104549]
MPLRPRSQAASPPRPRFSFSLSPSPAPEYVPSTGTQAPVPPSDFLPERDMFMFGANPLLGEREPGRGLVRCGRCQKVGTEWAAGEHRRLCNHVLDGTPLVAKKPIKASKMSDAKRRRLSEAEVALPLRKHSLEPKLEPMDGIAEITNLGTATEDLPVKLNKSEIKRREKERIKREKMEAKEREKGAIAERKRLKALPINLDRQCGVINLKLIPCPRSLTCKSHNVGAKRAVEGRSRPFDELYLAWQREHNPNFKEPGPRSLFSTRASGGGSAAAGGKQGKKRKRTEGLGDGDPDAEGEEEWQGAEGVLGDAEMDGAEGLREMEDLVRVTRVAEERVRRTIDALGINSPPTVTTTSTNDTLPEHMQSAQDRHRLREYHTERKTIPVRELVPTKAAVASPGKKAFQPVWRTGGGTFSDMGKMLVQALAARPAGVGVGSGGVGGGGGGFGHAGQRQGSLGQRQSVPV